MKQNDFIVYQNKQNIFITKLEAKSLKLSICRLVLAVLIISFLLIGYYRNNQLYLISLVSLIAFILIVFNHNKIKKQLVYLKAQASVIQRYLDRYNDNWHSFKETGSDYVDVNNHVIKDLDLVGNNSLFQYINVAFTTDGKKRLIEKLTRTAFDLDLIKMEQESIKELADKNDFVLGLETYGQMIEKPKVIEKIIDEFIMTIKQSDHHNNKIIGYLIPVITIITLVIFLFKPAIKLTVILLPILVFSQWIFTVINLAKNKDLFKQVSMLSKCLINYQNICDLVNQTNFEAEHLNKIKANLNEAGIAFKELKKISSLVKQRNNLLAGILLNGLLLWDYNCRSYFNQWMIKYGNQIEFWLKEIGELESLASLQVLTHLHDDYCLATISAEPKPKLTFKQAYHPLIDADKVVANSFTMSEQVCIITGSNMSGKTTFLRTIGINLVLAYAGGVCLAKEFDCSLMKIYTSMRIVDETNGISTFYQELLRIKEIVNANDKGEVMIALIDEIFKGTNSKDRIIGAKATVKRLSTANIYTLITTHDFELCDLENAYSCCNYHFLEYYQDNEIMFDYLIKEGRCKTTNAQYLLKMVGIIS